MKFHNAESKILKTQLLIKIKTVRRILGKIVYKINRESKINHHKMQRIYKKIQIMKNNK